MPPLPTAAAGRVEPTAGPERRRQTGSWHATDAYAAVGAFTASVGTTALLFSVLTTLSGALGELVVAYVLFIAYYATLVALDQPMPIVRDRVCQVLVQSLAVLLLVALIFVVGFTLWRGRLALTHSNFFRQDMTSAGPLDPLTVGGIIHGAVGTLEEIGIALVLTVPLGLACAVFLSETRGAFPRFVRTTVDAMTALPSIVAGLFIYATLILALGFEKSGFAAACALSIMMLPIIIRAADVSLRLVPGSLKEASYALGAGHWRTVWHVVLPTARSGLTTAVILGTARGIGETSPVLLTAGYAATMNSNPLHGPMPSLPLLAFQLVRSPQPSYIARGFGAAAVLMVLVLVLFVVARLLGGRPAGQLSRRQMQRRARASKRDARRFVRRTTVDLTSPTTS